MTALKPISSKISGVLVGSIPFHAVQIMTGIKLARKTPDSALTVIRARVLLLLEEVECRFLDLEAIVKSKMLMMTIEIRGIITIDCHTTLNRTEASLMVYMVVKHLADFGENLDSAP